MTDNVRLNKEQILKAIEKLEKNPNDRIGFLGDVGVTVSGALGAAAAATVLGTTTASIPVITAVTGVGMVVAAPITLVAGAAVAGGAAIYGLSRLIKSGGVNEGKRKQLLNEYKERLRESEVKERKSKVTEHDKTRFYILLKKPIEQSLISPDDAQNLMQAVESGQIPLSEAYKLIGQIIAAGKTT